MMKDILLFSGGLDSLIAWYYLDMPQPVYIPLGHRYQKRELEAVQGFNRKLGMDTIITKEIPLGEFEEEDANIPFRNAFLVLMASYYGDAIWLALQKGELNVPDRTKTFTKEMTLLLSLFKPNHALLKVDSPFWDMTKVDMVRWYKEQGLDINILLSTTSCYKGTNCGVCSACFRRWVALILNGIEEKYGTDPWDSVLAVEYAVKARRGVYDKERCHEIITALNTKWAKEDWDTLKKIGV